MFTSLPFRRLLAGTTALSMLLPAISASAQDDTSTPPTRAGQIAQISGGGSFEGSGSGGWAAAQLNYPVSGDDSIYTQPTGQAAIALDSSRIALAGDDEEHLLVGVMGVARKRLLAGRHDMQLAAELHQLYIYIYLFVYLYTKTSAGFNRH